MKAELTIKDATHNLLCRHAIGRHGKNYHMKAVLLGKTKKGKNKVLVFGDRYWAGREHIKKIRYVEDYKLSPIKVTN